MQNKTVTISELYFDFETLMNIGPTRKGNVATGFTVGKGTKQYWHILQDKHTGLYRIVSFEAVSNNDFRYVYPDQEVTIRF